MIYARDAIFQSWGIYEKVRNVGFMTKRNLTEAQTEVSLLEMELQRKDKILRGLQERKKRMDAKV